MPQSFHKGHIAIPDHTPDQAQMFFALCNTLNYDLEEAKERAKKYFDVACFNAITKTQIAELIDKLLAQQARREQLN